MLTEEELELSGTVANCQMNRERELRGSNGYIAELGMDPVEWLRERHRSAWLDVCCGTGRALVQAAAEVHTEGIEIDGVDLVSFYWPRATQTPGLTLHTSSIREFVPRRTYELITSVHGLHYVGDKLGTLSRLASWLAPDGLLLVHLDPADIYFDGSSRPRQTLDLLRRAGCRWNGRRGLLRLSGEASFSVEYLGATTGGPNRTGQPSTKSHYQRCGAAHRRP